ncbi:hypothetical protein JAAARDRAFT_197762 [Jaapia argillacea MUCL 33604]|uniref:Rgp1-domain-containing protein n=1 Tax=Jaapia argillacea MUCL 33604 TaxID=933084 RepID=A0A067PE01_9AGAM|nr:hypothetical protein JAAARDRAFT_197762 [Jaapia argillacea MUCL 33604]
MATAKPGLDLDSGIHVVVTPSQSSYFAGEPFSVTIVITNTRSPQFIPSRSVSQTHKRGAHSISSAPLARPPTSPGTPRTAVSQLSAIKTPGGAKLVRRGFVGHGRAPSGAEDLPQFLEQSRKRLLMKSLSVSIPPDELEAALGDHNTNGKIDTEIRSPIPAQDPSPPLGRTPVLAMSPAHPHARKNSVLDLNQIHLQDMPQGPVSPFPSTPTASSSAFSLSLDPIAETAQSPIPPQTPYGPSPDLSSTHFAKPELSEAQRNNNPYGPRPPFPHSQSQSHLPKPQRRPSQLGLGRGIPSSLTNPASPSLSLARTSTTIAPNAEIILYSYAQLSGSLSIVPLPGSSSSQTPAENTRMLNGLRASLLRKPVMGGGSMDITSSFGNGSFSRRPRTHTRSPSLGSGLLSLLSPSSLVSLSPNTQAWSPAHRRSLTPSLLSPSSSSMGGGVGLGLGLGGAALGEEWIDAETPLPVFEVQPTMLAVDLTLGPGESRSYTYTLKLPANLPPTFRGRILRFSYELSVGVCRAGTLPAPQHMGSGANSSSKVMKVPIRVYNNVAVGRIPRPYDLMWPVAKRRDPVPLAKVLEIVGDSLHTKPDTSQSLVASPSISLPLADSYTELQQYARRLLASLPQPETNGLSAKADVVQVLSPPRNELELEREREDEGGLTGCREAVEILTRNPKKVSYDVNKDGVKVAVLTFTKSAYRLGETVLGVVELNERGSRARVLKLSAMLEAHESLPSCIALATNPRHLRRVHAEHHSSFVPSMLRTTFALDIPPDASPAFQVEVGKDDLNGRSTPGGLEWKVRLCLLVSVASSVAKTGEGDEVKMKHLVRDGPKGEWGSSWKASPSIAPMEYPDPQRIQQQGQLQLPAGTTPGGTMQAWAAYFASFVGPVDPSYHDGDEEGEEVLESEEDEEVDYGGGEEGWRELKVETVECEIPIKVWPGNTEFKAMEVVFDV